MMVIIYVMYASIELFNLNDVVTNAIDDIMINKVLVKVKLAAYRFDTPK
ncbi:MAG: hypothetical protein ACJ71L_05995 [Nitrososphaeraceae archaeon]